MAPFAATERHRHTEDHVLAQIDGNAAPKTLVHVREIQIALAQGDFAGIVSKHQAQMAADGANDSVLAGRTLFAQFAIVFRSNSHEVWTAECPGSDVKSPAKPASFETWTATLLESRLVSSPFKTVNLPLIALGIAQHVVKRAVFHHQDDDVFQVIQSSWHIHPRCRCGNGLVLR